MKILIKNQDFSSQIIQKQSALLSRMKKDNVDLKRIIERRMMEFIRFRTTLKSFLLSQLG